MLIEDLEHVFEGVMGLELFDLRDEVALFDHLQVQYVVEEADEKVHL